MTDPVKEFLILQYLLTSVCNRYKYFYQRKVEFRLGELISKSHESKLNGSVDKRFIVYQKLLPVVIFKNRRIIIQQLKKKSRSIFTNIFPSSNEDTGQIQ